MEIDTCMHQHNRPRLINVWALPQGTQLSLLHVGSMISAHLLVFNCEWLKRKNKVHGTITAPSLHRHCAVTALSLYCPTVPSLHHTAVVPSLHHHRTITAPCLLVVSDVSAVLPDNAFTSCPGTITAPSLHHHCTITAPS